MGLGSWQGSSAFRDVPWWERRSLSSLSVLAQGLPLSSRVFSVGRGCRQSGGGCLWEGGGSLSSLTDNCFSIEVA